MKLDTLHETFNSGAIAMRPAALAGRTVRTAPEKSNNLVGDTNDDRWYLQYNKLPKSKLNEMSGLTLELKEAVNSKDMSKIEEAIGNMSTKMKELL